MYITQESVGLEIGRFAGPDAVSRSDIRRRLEVLAWDCPLHYDDEIARQYGYQSAFAPVAMYLTFALPAYWSPGEPRPSDVNERLMPRLPAVEATAGNGSRMVTTAVDVEYLEAIYPGDRICGVSRIKSVVSKCTKIGKGEFIVIETTYRKQTDVIVAIDRLSIFRYANATGESG